MRSTCNFKKVHSRLSYCQAICEQCKHCPWRVNHALCPYVEEDNNPITYLIYNSHNYHACRCLPLGTDCIFFCILSFVYSSCFKKASRSAICCLLIFFSRSTGIADMPNAVNELISWRAILVSTPSVFFSVMAVGVSVAMIP